MKLTVTVDTSAVERRLRALEQNVPRQLAGALNDAIRKTERAIQSEIEARVDSPRPFTVRSTYVVPAKPGRLVAEVGLKRLQARYLRPLIEGGVREQKRSESLLGGRYYVPAPGAPLDRYGNVPRALLVGALRAARSGQKYRGARVIVGVPPGTKLDAGLWLATKRQIRPLLLFVDSAPSYSKRIDFYGVAQRTARSAFDRSMQARLRAALARP